MDIRDPDGGRAFPQNDLSGYGMGPADGSQGGMSLRDYIAGQALAGLCANSSIIDGGDAQQVKFAVRLALEMADAMLRSVPSRTS